MSTRDGPEELAEAVGAMARQVAGAIRRMGIGTTVDVRFQVIGHTQLDGSTETRDADVFSGLGFAARPPDDGAPEAVVVFVGEVAREPIIAAMKDEQTRAALFKLAGALAADETAMFNSGALVVIKSTGKIQAKSAAGVAAAVTTHADMIALKNAFATWVPVAMDGGAALKALLTTLINTGWPHGTSVFEAE